jgi:putative effector of murein hydrolase
MRRLLNARTLAYYTQAVLFIVPLIFLAALLDQGGAAVKSMTTVLMLAALFTVLEVARRCFPSVHATILRLTAPGVALLGNWIALMFFALMVKLPVALADESSGMTVVLGWLAAIVIGQVLNLLFTAFLAKLTEKLVNCMGRCSAGGQSRALESPRTQLLRSRRVSDVALQQSSKLPISRKVSVRAAEAPAPKAAAPVKKLRSVFLRYLKEGATDDAPTVLSGELLPIGQFAMLGHVANGGTLAEDDGAAAEFKRHAALERALLLEPTGSPLALHLRRALDATRAVSAPEEIELNRAPAAAAGMAGMADAADADAADADAADANAAAVPPPLELPTWDELFTAWSVIAVLAALAIVFIAPAAVSSNAAAHDALEAFVWLFQLSASLAAHVFATFLLKQRVPSRMVVAVQPALLSPLLMIAIAGGSSLEGFLSGCEHFILREAPATTRSLLPSAFAVWGPGRLVTINLVPAITVLAFPTSARMPEVQSMLPALVPLVLIAAFISIISMAVLSRLLVHSSDVFALSLVPHSVTVAVAIGFSDVLCSPPSAANVTAAAAATLGTTSRAAAGLCATDTVIATSGILSAVLTTITGRRTLDLLGLQAESNEFARGFSLGTTGQAMSVAALKMAGEERATGVAAICFALMAVWASLIFAIHAFVVRFIDPLAT